MQIHEFISKFMIELINHKRLVDYTYIINLTFW
jgi:hypothetical protein